MKRFVCLLALLLTLSLQAQFKGGGHIGVPVGGLADLYNFNAGADIYYFFANQDVLLNFGFASGFSNFFGGEAEIAGTTVDVDALRFIPAAVAARITLLGLVRFGPDLGYAFILNDDDTGGEFYWRVAAGIDVADTIELNAYYYGITKDASIGSIGLGLLFEF